jgi:hypothetical protein
MAAQATLKALLGELLACAASNRADEALEAWTSLEKHIRCLFALTCAPNGPACRSLAPLLLHAG